jgi:hypothetical protein
MDKQAVAEVKSSTSTLCLSADTAAPMSSCSLMGGSEASSSILHSTYATLVVSSATRGRMMGVVLNGPGIVFDSVAIRSVQNR